MTDDIPAAPGGAEEVNGTAQTGIDTSVPHSARIWNYWLVSCPRWRTDEPDAAEVDAFGGVGKKP